MINTKNLHLVQGKHHQNSMGNLFDKVSQMNIMIANAKQSI
jgi:hypothetical protein